MLREEFILIFIENSILIVEPLEGVVGILDGVMFPQEFIIAASLVSVRQNFKSFRNLLKLDLSCLPMFFVFVRMPLGSKLLIGRFNFKQRSILRDVENLIVVLHR